MHLYVINIIIHIIIPKYKFFTPYDQTSKTVQSSQQLL